MFSHSRLLLGVVALATVIGCASTPPNVQPIAATSDPTVEIQKTQEMLKEARAQQYDVLSPNNFADAERSLNKAIKYRGSGKDNEKVLEQVAYSRAWIAKTNEVGQLSQNLMKDVTDARAGAMRAGANEIFPKDWKKAGNKLENITADIEKGNIRAADKKGTEVTQTYRDLERRAVSQTFLGRADENIKAAVKDKADKQAPRTYAMAMGKYDNAQRIIISDPRNTAAIRRAAEDATRESQHLLDVNRRVDAGNSEELVLLAERQQKQISGLRRETATTARELRETERTNAELARRQTLLSKAERVRAELKPGEADVFTEGDRLMVRLKGLQFPTNQATLGPKNQALLRKVGSALQGLDVSKVRVEAHPDSTGNAERNLALSQKRAEAIENYILANSSLSRSQVEAVGVEYNKDDAKNGRQQRRVDLVIDTKKE
ncbi:OmpA family protein [Bdellovibrio sp. HCB2-146]|uniref:OmpA family protein n=1 Tax=Bdellovibrio sp. HCB2-146 TaxID=3394362 RepID=UPI0039BD6110